MNRRLLAACAVLALFVASLVTACATAPAPSPSAAPSPHAHHLVGAGGPTGPGNVLVVNGDAGDQVDLYQGFGPYQKSVVIAVGTGGDGSAWSGTVNFQASADGVNWYPLQCNSLTVDAGVGSVNLVQSSTGVNGVWSCNVGSYNLVQAVGANVGDGSATVAINMLDSFQPVTYTLTDAATGYMFRTSY